jgi:hypothetical protein
MPILGYVQHTLSVGRRPESGYPEGIIVALERLAGLMAEHVRIPGEVARESGVISPAIPI